MGSFSRLGRVLGAGLLGGTSVLGYVLWDRQQRPAMASWTSDYEPSMKWDNNWDRRDPKTLVKPSKLDQNNNAEKDITNERKKMTPTATRHILLIRHGQYLENGKDDPSRILTELGKEQADMTGQRLKELNLPYTQVVSSTMTRAKETTEIVHKHVSHLPLIHTDLLCEGAPIPPDPPSSTWRPEAHQFFIDGARIEAAFRKVFHRADPRQEKDSYEIIICHANVIRYFICRAMQFPPEGWLRMSLPHASITWISVRPSGRVSLRCLGDAGHMPAEKVTFV